MSRYRLLMMGTILACAVAAHAQQTTTADPPAKGVSGGGDAGLPTVEMQLQVLTEKLSLSGDQQNKIKPILKELHDATEHLAQDKSLSQEERLAQVRPQRFKADKKIREILSDEQIKKLDQYLAGPHTEMHGNLSGAKTPAP